MLADSKLLTTFWAEAVNTACYVHNRILVVKPYFKTPYELFRGRKPALSLMRPFRCHVTILNTLDHLGKFDRKSDEVFFVGYSINSKAFRVNNTRTKKVEENLHINFLKNKPIIIDSDGDNKDNDGPCKESEIDNQERPNAENSTKDVNTAVSIINTARFISATYEEKTHDDLHTCLFSCFLPQEEPKRITNALKDPTWVEAMQEELLQFHLQKVWTLVDLPRGKRVIVTKWVFRKKKDKRGIVIRNKARLVAQGFTQEEGIDYDEVFVPVARIKAIRLFLAYASFIGFLVYQMDVKSAFRYGRIKEEVYVCQPIGFEDPDYPDKVYKELCTEFEELMHDKFQMSSMGELTFFLRLQVKQKLDGIFISQDKYVDKILRKYKNADMKPSNTPMDKEKALLKDSDGDDVYVYLYRSMIWSLMYLTSSRPDIMFDVCTCAKFQVNSKVSYLHEVDGHDKTIIEASVRRHIKLAYADGISTLPTTEIFKQLALMGYVTDFDKLTFQKGPTSPVGTQDTPTVIETSLQLQNISITYMKTRTSTRRMGIRIPQSNVPSSIADEAITKEMHDGLGRATTTTSSLKVEQRSGNVSKTQTKAKPSRLSTPRTSSEGGLGEGNTSRSGEGTMQLLELMDLCTRLPDKVTALENEIKSTKVVYNKALITLTKRVKKLEKKLKYKRRRAVIDSSEDEEASLDNEDSPKQGRMIEEIDEDENVNLVKSSKQGEAHETTGHRMESDDTEVVDFSTASPQKYDDDLTVAETLVNIKKSAAKDKEITMLFDKTMESIRKFVPMESEGQIADSKTGEGSSKEGESLKRPVEEEMGQEQQKVKEDLSQERTPKKDPHAGRKNKKVKCLEESSEYRRFNSRKLMIWREITILGEDCAPNNQENRGREYGRKTVLVENPTENAFIAQDGIGSQVSDKVKIGLGYKAASPVVESFVNLSKMLENQENVKSRSDKGYHAVPPPYIGNYIPPKPDIMFTDEQVKSESMDVVSNVASSDVKTIESKHEIVDVKNKGVYSTLETKPVRKDNFSPLIIEDWNSDDESEVEFEPKVEVKTIRPSIEKIKFVKSAREKVKKVKTTKQNKNCPGGNQRN
nr:retrovirus-related Pol polyprotein from transposon TNT 1-94 [Tanacetum cinerariifolium]